MAETFDVIIIGGGPAGSTAATLLAQQGRKVGLVEKDIFPRFKIGESLLPGSLRTLQRMGVKEKIEATDMHQARRQNHFRLRRQTKPLLV